MECTQQLSVPSPPYITALMLQIATLKSKSKEGIGKQEASPAQWGSFHDNQYIWALGVYSLLVPFG